MAQRSVLVRVPATSANLGPGFDSLGVALDWTADFRLVVADETLPRPEGPVERMVVGAALSLYTRAAARQPAGITATYEGDIPVGRGLGVSAAARVAGLLAADALLDIGEVERGPDALLLLAAQLERHADNAAP